MRPPLVARRQDTEPGERGHVAAVVATLSSRSLGALEGADDEAAAVAGRSGSSSGFPAGCPPQRCIAVPILHAPRWRPP